MINISKNKCVGCGICASMCPEDIKIADGLSIIKNENISCLRKAMGACPQKAIQEIERDFLFAIGTDDEKTIKSDDHVGMSKYYSIWKYSNGNLTFQEKRENIKFQDDESRIYGDPEKAKIVSSILKDVDVIVGKIIGPNIVRMRIKFVLVATRELKIKKVIEIIKENINEIYEEYNKKERMALVLQ